MSSTAVRDDRTNEGDADRGWTLSDLLWLLDGDWSVTTLANRVIATRGPAEVVVGHREGRVRATARVDGEAVGVHESRHLTEAMAGVRADLRRAGR